MAVAKELKAKGVVVELGRRIQSNMAGFWRSRKSASRSDESSQNSSQAKESRKPGSTFIYPVLFAMNFGHIYFHLRIRNARKRR